MPSIFVKDDLRASVEAATGGKITVLYTASGQPSYMNVIPRFSLQDIDASLGTGTHPAFIVNGVTKSEIFIGTYQGISKNGEFLSLPGVDPHSSINHDQFVSLARANGPGWHCMTNAEWAAIQLWCWKNGFMPRGNSNYGKSSDSPIETGRRQDKKEAGDTSGAARTLTGSGPASWRHDNSHAGISDLNGNVWEWSPGMRVVAGEIQVIPNNNAALMGAAELSATGTAWQAISGVNGSLVTPGATNSVRYATSGTADYTLVRASGSSFEGMTNPGAANPVQADALQVLKAHGLFPVASTGLGADYFGIDLTQTASPLVLGERLPIRGGNWQYGSGMGVFALDLSKLRSSTGANIGARPAFVL